MQLCFKFWWQKVKQKKKNHLFLSCFRSDWQQPNSPPINWLSAAVVQHNHLNKFLNVLVILTKLTKDAWTLLVCVSGSPTHFIRWTGQITAALVSSPHALCKIDSVVVCSCAWRFKGLTSCYSVYLSSTRSGDKQAPGLLFSSVHRRHSACTETKWLHFILKATGMENTQHLPWKGRKRLNVF